LDIISTQESPPTHFTTNFITQGFQDIVSSYGVARYREINPAVFTIVTFPFEFGVMFGDVGHGIILLLFAIYLIYKEKEWQGQKINEMIEMFYSGRYLIFLMALFSIYQGFLYNEFFSLPMNFGSVWKLVTNDTQPGTTYSAFNIPGYPENFTEPPTYVFGVDPVWKGSSNELLYYNSVKMKMSIIIGIVQMSLGIFLHLLNALHFKLTMDIFGEFLPRIIFLWSIFGYLCFMIFFKWGTNYPAQNIMNIEWKKANNVTSANVRGPYQGTSDAPVLLNELIFMVLPGGKADNLYKGQQIFQYILVILAIIMIPIMCCLKPCHHKHFAKQKIPKQKLPGEPDQPESDYQLYHTQEAHEEDFSEILVHQLLETIEFVLGSVSHTASYLRLWALSLAHSELATVFWDKVMFLIMEMTIHVHPFVVALAIFAAFSIWFFITFLVMMFMEGLSAFLHALRLHWVEFQSKFYKGDGYQFQPFNYDFMSQEQN